MTDPKLNKVLPREGSQPTIDATIATYATTVLPFPVIGIVGAAGSRQALETFFRNLPDDAGMAFVVVTRLPAKHNRQLATAIEARTDMPVVTAADGAVIQVDHVYIAPAGIQLTVEEGRFRLQNPNRSAPQTPLDLFLTSLANEHHENAVAILFSGTGEDGILGLQQVKAQNGLSLVQEPDDAAHPALPRRAVAAALADIVGKAGELAQRLVQMRGDLAQSSLAVNQEQEESFSQIFTAILGEIATQIGHDLSHYKSSTLRRRILRRMGMATVPSIMHYLEFLQTNPAETTALFRDCLVSVTSFFRDPDAYEMLERDCVSQLFLEKGRSDFVRVWVAGCATGEEAYSIAIQLAERAAQVQEPPHIQIFATDLDEEAIAIARRGLYPAPIAKDIAPARLQRYFSEENGAYRVKPEIREHVLFAVHDLLKDPPFSRVDLICCRNVLIYFNREAQEKVFATFHYALNRERGYLFLGTSESVDAATDLFAVLNKHCHLYQRRNVVSLPHRRELGAPATTAMVAQGGKGAERTIQRQIAKPRTIEEMYTAWTLRAHTPPRLLVNENYDITHLFGGADRYLQERDGAITQHILQKILPDLRLDLRVALYQAFNKGERTISRLLRVDLGNQAQMVQLHVGPVAEAGFPQDYVEVVFAVKEDATLFGLTATTESVETDLSLVARMEEELLRTRERLQTIIEEYELSSQELKASNEELQSINEELKSTTEELETSKEELQSMNEELVTVNNELNRKIEELHRANSDLLNLITATDVGAIFLSNTLQIKRFTPRATDLFNLIDSDVNRPFAHVTHRLHHSRLSALVAHVTATATRIEETLQRDDGHWFSLRIFPYRTIAGAIDGVVITFLDINDLKRAESEERQRRQQQSLAELSRQALIGNDLDHFMTALTQQVAQVLDMELCKVLELQPDGTLLLKAGVGWREGLVGQVRLTTETSAQAGYTLQSHAPVVVRDLRTETRFRAPILLSEHEVRSGMSVMIPTESTPGEPPDPQVNEPLSPTNAYGVLGVYSRQPRVFATYDVDFLQSVANLLAATIARRRSEAAVRASEERFRSLIEQASDAILIANLDGVYTDVNSSACQLLGYARAELIGKKVSDLLPAVEKTKVESAQAYLITTGETQVAEWTLIHKDGTPILTETSAKILSSGIWQTIVRDITERKQTEMTLRRYADMLQLSYDAIIVWSPQAGIEFWNQGAETLYGYSAQEARGQVTHQLLATAHPRSWGEIFAELQRVGVWEGEVTHTTKTGAKLFVSTRHQIVEGANGNRAVLEINRDITTQKQAEAELRESEERFRVMADTAPILIWVSGLDQGRTFFNKAWLEFTGRTMQQELGTGWLEGVHPADYERCLTTYTTAFAARQSFEIEYRLCGRDGSYCWMLDKGAPRFAPDGSFIGFIGGCIDIDDRKQAETILTRYQLLSNHVRDIILFLRLDGQIVDANAAAVEVYGYDRATLLDMKIHDLRDPATHALIATQMAQADREESERGIRFETVHRRRDGSAFPVEVGSIGADIDGERLLMSVIRDISERKAVEVALAASEAKFSTAFSLSPLILTITALDTGRLIEVNESFVRTTGYTRAEALGRTPDELGLWANPQERLTGLARLAVGETVEKVEALFRMKNGELRTCLLGATLVEINGQPAALTALTDITERKQAEERLHFLAEASTILASSLDYSLTLENVAHAAVPGIADWCAIDLVAEDGTLEDGFVAHIDPTKVRWAKELRKRYPIDPNGPVGTPHVIRTGQSEFYPEITDAMLQAVAKNAEELQLLRSVGYRSIIIAPLQAHGRVLGAITFVATESERHFTTDDLTMAEELARRAAAAIGNALLHRAVQQRERELHASEERLRLATEAGKIGIYDHDLLTNQTTYSAIYLAITGIKPDEQLTQTEWLERVHPDDRNLVLEKLHRAVTYGESYDYEYRIYQPDGTLRWLGISSRASLDEAGRTIRLTGALSDITERKQAEEEIQRLNRDLKRRLDELQSLLDVAPIGIFVAQDPACQIITGNAIGAQMLGIQPAENASKSAPSGDALPFRVLRNGRELAPEEMPMQIAVQHDIPILNWEVDVVHTDGRVVNLYEYAMPLHDEEGKVRGCLGIFVDITERRQAEESLRESEERFRSAFEQAAVGMAHVSLDGRYLRVNDRLCAILGYQREELLQKTFLELTHPEDRATSMALSESLVANRIPSYSTEKRYLRRDGAMTWVNLTASVVCDPQGEVKYRLAVIEDIAARKAAEAALHELTATLELRVEQRTAELERSNQELDQFAYVASHDLKAPLRAIVNLSSWIAEDSGAALPAPSLEHLEKLRGRALRMERLLDDLLEYSRVGRRDGIVEKVKVETLIQDVIYLLAPPPGFQVSVTSALPVLITPRTPLELVFRNLIGNAIKHHHQPATGEVQISAHDRGDFVEFSISDNGPGIDPYYHERIFGMFQVLRPRDEVEGSGMGLAIVKKTVEYRQGEVWVASAEGKGTTFYFTWPKGIVDTTEGV